MRSIVDDLVVTCDEIVDTPVTESILMKNKILACYCCAQLRIYYLMVVIVVKYYMKCGSIIPCLLSS